MAILVPAILTKDPDEVHEKLKFLEDISGISDIQIDFADGKFVPNELAYPKDIGDLKTRLKVEAHLMVRYPQQYFDQLKGLGANMVIVHYESFLTTDELVTALRNLKQIGFACGVAVNPQTDVLVYDYFIDNMDLALVMGVHPGFQGQEFVKETLKRIETLRKQHGDVIIEVDGGVKLDNIAAVVGHGADRVVVGSGIWQTTDAKQTIYQLLKKLTPNS